MIRSAALLRQKTQDQVRKLIAGSNDVYICDDCIELCAEILEEEFDQNDKGPDFSGINLLKPKEIKEFLDEYVRPDEAKKGAVRSSLQPLQKNHIQGNTGGGASEE